MATKSIFKRWDGANWVEYYFKTSADLIDETTSYKVMTAAERTAISTYLTSGFGGANQLIQADANGLIPAADIPTDLAAYLKTANPTFTGTLSGPTISVTGSTPTVHLNGSAGNVKSLSIIGNATTNDVTIYSEGAMTISNAPLDIDFAGSQLTGVADPSAGDHAATKGYVDALVSVGLRWASNGPVYVATTANITLSGLQTIDGKLLVEDLRVLVKNQTTAAQNGIYTVKSGAWVKDTTDSAKGIMVFVEQGDTYNDWTFQATTATTWIETSKVDTILAGTSLTKSGNTISVSNGGITNTQIANTTIDLSTKTAAFTSLDNANASYDTWVELTSAATSENLTVKINKTLAAIGLLRGTANYNTNNTETIAGAYDLAEVKNRTYQGTTSTPTSGTFVTGDLYFYELA